MEFLRPGEFHLIHGLDLLTERPGRVKRVPRPQRIALVGFIALYLVIRNESGLKCAASQGQKGKKKDAGVEVRPEVRTLGKREPTSRVKDQHQNDARGTEGSQPGVLGSRTGLVRPAQMCPQ